jgi:hypothetical protein
MVIVREEYKTYESFIDHEYIKKELAKAYDQAKDPNAKWYNEEEVDAMLDEGL